MEVGADQLRRIGAVECDLRDDRVGEALALGDGLHHAGLADRVVGIEAAIKVRRSHDAERRGIPAVVGGQVGAPHRAPVCDDRRPVGFEPRIAVLAEGP